MTREKDRRQISRQKEFKQPKQSIMEDKEAITDPARLLPAPSGSVENQGEASSGEVKSGEEENGVERLKAAETRSKDGKFLNSPGPGRPIGAISLVGLLKEYLLTVPPKEKKTRAVLFVENQLGRAMKGDKNAAKAVWGYIDGLPQAHIDLTSGMKPIPLLDVLHNNGDKEAQ